MKKINQILLLKLFSHNFTEIINFSLSTTLSSYFTALVYNETNKIFNNAICNDVCKKG
jgi:hypothetical protein